MQRQGIANAESLGAPQPALTAGVVLGMHRRAALVVAVAAVGCAHPPMHPHVRAMPVKATAAAAADANGTAAARDHANEAIDALVTSNYAAVVAAFAADTDPPT